LTYTVDLELFYWHSAPEPHFSKFSFVNIRSCYYFNVKFLLTVNTLLRMFSVSRKQNELVAT